ncbi:hypothetical protein [Nocardia sp. NPDC127526]|uniref:hypothetical protein n=1 Tax=Nocardia sp. NPDC127526 TaxID=3345393 RepID=UPI003632472C
MESVAPSAELPPGGARSPDGSSCDTAAPQLDGRPAPAEDVLLEKDPGSEAVRLAAGVEAVVARWNPHGLALWRAMRSAARADGGSVALIGEGDVNVMLLRSELARCTPRIDLFEAGGDSTRSASAGDDEVPPPAVALVVLDGGSPIGAEMLGTVRGLWADGTRIVFALNGIHAHEEWAAVRAQDIARLAAEIPEAAGTGAGESGVEIIAVSARMAAVGRASGDGALVDRSGVGVLHARLVAAAGAGAAGDQVAMVRERVLAETRERIAQQLEKLRGGGDVAALREERARLLAVGDGGRGSALAMVRNRTHLARVDLVHEVGVRIRAVNAGLRGEVERLPRGAHKSFPLRVSETVEKLTYEIDRLVRLRVHELTRQIEQALGVSGWEIDTGESPRAPGAGPDPQPRWRGVEDHLVLAFGASAGFGFGRFVVAPLAWWEALDYAIVPVSLVLGVAVAGWVVRARRHLAERAHLQQWVSEALVNVKAQLEQRVTAALMAAEERLTEQVVGAATARMVETDLRVGELEAQLRQAAHRRPGLTTACERDLAVLGFA